MSSHSVHIQSWLTVDVVDLCRPEEEQDEVVTTAQECDEEDDNHCFLCLLEQARRRHRVGGEPSFPDKECDDQD